ncbi:MAG TPA: T9SS type A sorting domain-containing protein [Chitinophagaceae bacterium]|nr:T9SS type A sorting domain-containing protein [Chitinophagaceae bacterium]HPH31488.1 T9SS type A sorting domain-containing protein [Chitinophagaceae bacterium]HPN59782.1 T9SS type A sorting domain-containing protein [Chitinophagaceae bacterium]
MNTLMSRMYFVLFNFIRPYSLLFFILFVSLQVRGSGHSAAHIHSYTSQQLYKVDTGGGILPLHNFTLTVTLKENTVFLKWVAENEMNTEKFVIQRSTDGNSFKNMGELPPTGPINILTEYNSADDIQGIVSNVAYYRIKAEDNRGNFAYSNVVPVRLTKADGFSFWPNPFSTSLNLSYNASLSTSIRVEMYDNSGRRVIQQLFNVNRGMNQLSVNGAAGLSHGLYHVRIIDLLTNEVSFSKMAK